MPQQRRESQVTARQSVKCMRELNTISKLPCKAWTELGMIGKLSCAAWTHLANCGVRCGLNYSKLWCTLRTQLVDGGASLAKGSFGGPTLAKCLAPRQRSR